MIPSGPSGNIVPTRSVTMSQIKIGGGSNKEIKDLSPLKDEIGGSPRFLDTPGEESPGTRSKKVSIVSPYDEVKLHDGETAVTSLVALSSELAKELEEIKA